MNEGSTPALRPGATQAFHDADWRRPLQQEWQLLQAEHEHAERMAFWLRAGAILLCFASLAIAMDLLLSGLLLVVLWLQEAIVRTGQARVGARLLQVETALRDIDGNAQSAFQMHSGWVAARGQGPGLLAEYAGHARRPTVAVVYAALLAILLLAWLLPAA